MFGRSARRRSAAVATLMCAVLAGCTNTPQPAEPTAPPPAPALPATGLPQVTPQPKEMRRLGDDIAVRGKAEVVVDQLVDQPTRALVEQVLRMAGASDVVVREEGQPPAEDAELRIEIGARGSQAVAQGLGGFDLAAPAKLPPEGYALAGRGGTDPAVVIGASDAAGAYYGVQTLRQLASPGRIAGVGIIDHPDMPLRGSVEGFYGPPWTHQQRMDQLAFYGDVKLNTYIYAPKDDPYHREKWREPYPQAEFAAVRQLIGQAAAHHVKFTFALSPGTSICYSDEADFRALLAKLQAVYDSGVRDFSVPLDDISYTRWNCSGDQAKYGSPSQDAAGRAQAELLNRVQREFVDTHPGVAPLQFVPTEYSDVEDSPYKSQIRSTLDDRVLVMWTGDGVIPRRITVSDAQQAEQVWGRKLFLWDNYPVNDFDGSVGRVLLGPYEKREPGLTEQLTGGVVNPMNLATASEVVELGAADFFWNNEGFDAQRAWRAAADYLAGKRLAGGEPGLVADPATAGALLAFFDLEHMGPLPSGRPWLPQAPELSRRIEQFRAGWQGGDRATAVRELREYAQTIAEAPERIGAGAPAEFVQDVKPWLTATELWGQALVATMDGLQARADGDEGSTFGHFSEAKQLATRAAQIRTEPGKVRPQGPVYVGDGVLDTFIEQAPGMR
ncbi:hyaluronoglucosaminidase [Saccharopolyspora antimicrobica]|uniref:Hyaluronoglucosaminidase n=1 Tax=Saccharopolyspora antimicrobica TaxID=455193 RepID=A0A1I5IYV0_9PSEU|nr:beta-N-acetylglucosaminidase domain-containing protein [Saccharopolyspora antimicrobica]RKT83792.1 hyaluronoglucosaminidase [Saccharopolyspora antimicrobica]SFO65589.1 hyaluronoglucosaminidase [Saccharopolyspora antimicrobica]